MLNGVRQSDYVLLPEVWSIESEFFFDLDSNYISTLQFSPFSERNEITLSPSKCKFNNICHITIPIRYYMRE